MSKRLYFAMMNLPTMLTPFAFILHFTVPFGYCIKQPAYFEVTSRHLSLCQDLPSRNPLSTTTILFVLPFGWCNTTETKPPFFSNPQGSKAPQKRPKTLVEGERQKIAREMERGSFGHPMGIPPPLPPSSIGDPKTETHPGEQNGPTTCDL